MILGILPCMPTERATLLVRLAPELKLKLSQLAKRERRSLSKQVEILLEECLLRTTKPAELSDSSQVGERTRLARRKIEP